MKKVNSEEVAYELSLGQQEKTKTDKEFENIFLKSNSEEKRKLTKCMKSSWEELFENSEIIWYKTELPSDTEFTNKIFDSGKGFMREIGMTQTDFQNEYNSGKMKKEFIERINSIRNHCKEIPRIIVLTNDMKNYVILDGARRALALRLEKKQIPVYLGYKKQFNSLKHFTNLK